MRLSFDWVDAFSDAPFGGNGCAVVHDAADVDDETATAVVRETGLVECTFLSASGHADWRVRYFMADREIPFAGHPTLATAASLHDRGLMRGGRLRLETGAGVVPVDLVEGPGGPRFSMTQRAPRFGPEMRAAQVAAVVGLSPDDIAAPPQIVSTGLPFCITLLKDHDALRRARLDSEALRAFRLDTRFEEGVEAMEPYLLTLRGATASGDTFARLLLAPPLPPEDPFTGSATGAAAAYLWSRGLIGGPRYTAEQGHWMGRPGQAEVEVLGPPDSIAGVRVAGAGYVLMRGEIRL